MGPSGAGKTCLLDVLSGRKSLGTVCGSVAVNGRPVALGTMKEISGLVIGVYVFVCRRGRAPLLPCCCCRDKMPKFRAATSLQAVILN